MCGVAAMAAMPSRTAASASATDPASSAGPSSMPGSRCAWRSIRAQDASAGTAGATDGAAGRRGAVWDTGAPMRGARNEPMTTALWAGAAVVAALVAALVSSRIAPGREGSTAAAAAALLGAFLIVGRRDLARPQIAMPVVFYAGVLVAQLKLLKGYETTWSDETTFLVLTGPLLFALGAALLSGGRRRPEHRISLAG